MKDNNNKVIELLGWLGGVLVLVAYGLNSSGVITANSSPYQLLNLIGSALLMLIALKEKAYPNVFVNISWILIALIGLINGIVGLK